jgi:hypothetical protein
MIVSEESEIKVAYVKKQFADLLQQLVTAREEVKDKDK